MFSAVQRSRIGEQSEAERRATDIVNAIGNLNQQMDTRVLRNLTSDQLTTLTNHLLKMMEKTTAAKSKKSR